MRIHILGICGTFMAGIAVLAKQMGYQVSGSDEHVYPPMSDQLAEQGITLMQGYDATHLQDAEMIIIGNAMRRGYPIVEHVLNAGLPYTSGPQWLAEHVLQGRWVLAVSGTHGKTTTASMLTWMLHYAGLNPGYLIGGIAQNFPTSVSIGETDFFVIEADEYDSAFFDKRSKFIHYHPRTLIINNIEFDHADIFTDIADIQKQFHHLIRTVPGNGLIISNADDKNVTDTLKQGVWSEQQNFAIKNGDWRAADINADGSAFTVCFQDKHAARVNWQMLGMHNISNALAAIAAAHHAGVPIEQAAAALAEFKGVKRRMEVRGVVNNITVYDDFAHHPTAIKTTLAGLRKRISANQRIIAILELGSYTMRSGVHGQQIFAALSDADQAILLNPDEFTLAIPDEVSGRITILNNIDAIVESVLASAQSGDHIVVMSNRGFAGIHQQLLNRLAEQELAF